MKKKILLTIAGLAVAGAILGLTVFKGHKNGVVKYRTEALAKGDLEALVVTSGALNPVRLVEVGSQVSGKIDKLYVDFNSQVKAGQILAELDQSLLKAKIDQNNANYLSAVASLERSKVTLDNLKKKYERSLSLFDKNLISFEEKEAAEAAYLGAKADLQSSDARLAQAKSLLDSSKVDLAYATIRSPIDGIVINRLINIGQTVAASFQAPKLFEIANDLSKMQVECDVDEADIGKVKEGQKVRFTVDSFPNETFFGTVNQVRYSPTVTSNVVTYTTIVDVDNPGMKLRPGMTATVSIISGEAKNVLRVPNAALRFTPNLPAEEMQKIMKEAGERMAARRRQEGGSEQTGGGPEAGAPGQNAPAAATPQAIRPGEGGQRPTISSQDQGAAAPQGARLRQPSRVWIQDENGKLQVVFIRPGVADNSYTEVLRGELQEGQKVVIGTEGGPIVAATPGGPGQPGRMMFIGR
jgi:HlyD family secretion protein